MKKIVTYLRTGNKKIALAMSGIACLLAALVIFVCIQYYQQLQSTIREESSDYLKEISSQISTRVRKTVTENFSMLHTVTTLLENTAVEQMSDLRPVLEQQRENWNYNSLILLGENGMMYDSNDVMMPLLEGDYLSTVLIDRQPALSPAQTINGQECILFAVPMRTISVDGLDFTALGATFLLETFDQNLSTSAFGGAAYSFVINKDGTMAVPSSNAQASAVGYNVLSYLDHNAPAHSKDLQEMRAQISMGTSGQIDCTMLNGDRQYVSYYPIGAQDWYLVTFVPVSVVNAKSEILLKITLWFCTFIVLCVAGLVTLLATGFMRNKRRLEKIAFVDPLTGGNTMQYFYLHAEKELEESKQQALAVVYTNIEKFRLLNEQHGRATGDKVLYSFDKVVREDSAAGEFIGHAMADHFCLLVYYDSETALIDRFARWQSALTRALEDERQISPTIQFGVYLVSEPPMPVTLMTDRAKFALREVKSAQNARVRYAIYDERQNQKLFREKQLEDRMEHALYSGEFIVYLQPKYCAKQECIRGAEALVRWRSGTEGMIFPDEFIPLFEKNGFIVQIDLFVFETVCQTLRRWMDEGREPVTVSVNCSRLHFTRPDFFLPYKTIYERYDIPAKYLELELTESIVYENMEQLSKIIDQIHAAGFTCSIDDFGSGYSSLNMLKDIEADVLKLDKIFFREEHNPTRAQSVVENIIRMAQALSMQTVAEGVEYPSQVEQLRAIGCDYIQGYVFSKPVPIAEFEALAFPQTS